MVTLIKTSHREEEGRDVNHHGRDPGLVSRRENVQVEVKTRVVESESREVGKSLKIGKNRKKSEKSDLISYPTFWQKCQNAKMP